MPFVPVLVAVAVVLSAFLSWRLLTRARRGNGRRSERRGGLPERERTVTAKDTSSPPSSTSVGEPRGQTIASGNGKKKKRRRRSGGGSNGQQHQRSQRKRRSRSNSERRSEDQADDKNGEKTDRSPSRESSSDSDRQHVSGAGGHHDPAEREVTLTSNNRNGSSGPEEEEVKMERATYREHFTTSSEHDQPQVSGGHDRCTMATTGVDDRRALSAEVQFCGAGVSDTAAKTLMTRSGFVEDHFGQEKEKENVKTKEEEEEKEKEKEERKEEDEENVRSDTMRQQALESALTEEEEEEEEEDEGRLETILKYKYLMCL